MKKLILVLFVLSFCSCSTEEQKTHYNAKRLSFNVYDQGLETILVAVSKRYDLDLDFEVTPEQKKYSLSVLNASVNDVLKKLSSSTGYFMKVIEGEIVVESKMLADSQTEINLTLNDNLWKDIRSGSKEVRIDPLTIKKFFGPLFSNVHVNDVNSSSKTVQLYLPKEDVPFIKKSLLYLNYLEQQRTPVITVFLVEKGKTQKFIKSLNAKEAKFAWKLNAGDNINFTNNDGDKIHLVSQLLSEEDNISGTEVFIKLKYKEDAVEHNFNFTKSAVQSINFSDTFSLIAKADWYVEGFKITDENLNSKAISSYKKPYSERVTKILNSSKAVKTGNRPLTELANEINLKDYNCRVVSFTSNEISDIEKFSLDLKHDNYTLQNLLKEISQKTTAKYFVDEFGILIDCQGTISSSRNIAWKILPEPLGLSFYTFTKGSFDVNKEGLNSPVVYLPSANALIGLSNSNILKD